MQCSSPSMETNFYMTRINPAGKLQCCPDALGSCDYNEVLGTDGRGRGPSTGFVTVQIPSLPDMPRSSVSGGEKGLWRQPHTQASCRLGPAAAPAPREAGTGTQGVAGGLAQKVGSRPSTASVAWSFPCG